jgi:hypothetical protein
VEQFLRQVSKNAKQETFVKCSNFVIRIHHD